MASTFSFAFGRPLRPTPPHRPSAGGARAFIVGVYASALHARWIDAKGKLACRALAVDIEPFSFWDGSDADARVASIQSEVPPEAGRLEAAEARFNGPSGRTLDELYLRPLGLSREEVWITDLHDTYFLSPGNAAVIGGNGPYARLARRGRVPPASLPPRPIQVRPTVDRMSALAREFAESGADLVITLGNEPIRPLLGAGAKLLDVDDYGASRAATLFGRQVNVLHLCHPRQAGRLGASSSRWGDAHGRWMRRSRRS